MAFATISTQSKTVATGDKRLTSARCPEQRIDGRRVARSAVRRQIKRLQRNKFCVKKAYSFALKPPFNTGKSAIFAEYRLYAQTRRLPIRNIALAFKLISLLTLGSRLHNHVPRGNFVTKCLWDKRPVHQLHDDRQITLGECIADLRKIRLRMTGIMRLTHDEIQIACVKVIAVHATSICPHVHVRNRFSQQCFNLPQITRRQVQFGQLYSFIHRCRAYPVCLPMHQPTRSHPARMVESK